MDQLLRNKEMQPEDPVNSLQQEIALLEAELEKVKKELGAFELQIQTRLATQIARVRELFDLYKWQKAQKKAKRLEQKKRGKNYKEPKQLKPNPKQEQATTPLNPDEHKELKRLYKEAVVHVHPDKFIHAGEEDKVQRATSITAQLNGIYKRGDLEELINLYQYIISGNAVAAFSRMPEDLVINGKVRLDALKRKREAVAQQLEQIKSAYTYQVLMTYENPLVFIDELHHQFVDRIQQLEKRTRKR